MDLEGGRHLTFDHQGKRFTVLTHDDFQRTVEQAITAKKVQEQLPLLRSALGLLKENPTESAWKMLYMVTAELNDPSDP